MTPIFLIVGAPASGKSTASRALAARFPKSIAICVDDLRSMVVGGVVHPSNEWSRALVEQLQLARKSVTEMATIYHRAGFAIVIDDFWDPHSRMSEYRELFDWAELRRVVLYPDQQKAHAQNLRRAGPGEFREYLDAGIREVYADLNKTTGELAQTGWIILDTTDDTAEDTAARLQALAAA